MGVAWRGVAGNVGVAWQGNVWFFFLLPSEIILFVHFNVESAFFGSVRPTRFRHGEGGPRTRHARTFTFTSTSTSTPHPHPHPHASTPYARDHHPPPTPPPLALTACRGIPTVQNPLSLTFSERESGLQALLPPFLPSLQAPPPAFGQMCAADCGLLGGVRGMVRRSGGRTDGTADRRRPDRPRPRARPYPRSIHTTRVS